MLKKFFVLVFLTLVQSFCVTSSLLPLATDLDDKDMRRCLAACHSSKEKRLIKEEYWKGDHWDVEEGRNTPPSLTLLGINPDSPPLYSNVTVGDYESGIFIGKGNKIIVAWPGASLLNNVEDYVVFGGRSEDFTTRGDGRFFREGLRGIGHWGSFQMYRAVSDDLWRTVQKYVGESQFNFSETQIITVGHSFGGMVAQYAAIDMINRFYNTEDCPNRNNVVAVTLGAPRVFDAIAADSWNIKIGGESNHLRIVTSHDQICDRVAQHLTVPNVGRTFFGRLWRGARDLLIENRQDTFYTGKKKIFDVSGVETHSLGHYTKAFKNGYQY